MKKFQIPSSKLYAILIAVFLFVVSRAEAQFGFTNYLDSSPGQQLNIKQLFNILNGLVCYFFQFAVITLGTMLIIYGLMFLKSRGSPQGITEARKALTWGIVGGLVIFSVFTIVLSVASLVGVDFPVISQIQRCSL